MSALTTEGASLRYSEEPRTARVVYLTWGETPRSIGVYGSQVIEQLSHLGALGSQRIKLIAGLPLAHSGLFRERLRYFAEIRRLRNKLGKIAIEFLPIYAPQNLFYSTRA